MELLGCRIRKILGNTEVLGILERPRIVCTAWWHVFAARRHAGTSSFMLVGSCACRGNLLGGKPVKIRGKLDNSHFIDIGREKYDLGFGRIGTRRMCK